VGYRPRRTLRKLDFSGTEYDGLEIIMRPVPMSVVYDVAERCAVAPQDPAAARHVAATFAYALESWNVEDDDGQPVPADLDGLLSQDPQFVFAVIAAWMAAMAGMAAGA
jgi:hypothetical protein